MAVVGKNGLGKFFIYDHNKLKKEEDDLKDAIVYFYPYFTHADEQCALCGQLMGMSEFLQSTISQSVPTIFKLQIEKYCLKRIGDYSMGLEGSLNESDFHLQNQLEFLYQTFVMFCGSFQNIAQQFENIQGGFVFELQKIWKVLYPSACFHNNFISQVFQVLPTVHLPKSGNDLFCQASDILQSSQRRPGVHGGAILYKNKVLCTHIPPNLMRKLVLVKPEMPCIRLKTDYEISRSVRLITIYLTCEEMKALNKTFQPSVRHNLGSKFLWDDSMNKTTFRGMNSGRNSSRQGKIGMESIPEKYVLMSYDLKPSDDGETCAGNGDLRWTALEDYSESPVLESRKVSGVTKTDKVETISDLEESVNGYGYRTDHIKSYSESQEHMVDITDGHVIVNTRLSESLANRKKSDQHIITADVHINAGDSYQTECHNNGGKQSMPDTSSIQNQTEAQDKSKETDKLSNENTPNISNNLDNSNILNVKTNDTSGIADNNSSQVSVDLHVGTKLDLEDGSLHFDMDNNIRISDLDSLTDPQIKHISSVGCEDLKVDCLHECNCECNNTSDNCHTNGSAATINEVSDDNRKYANETSSHIQETHQTLVSEKQNIDTISNQIPKHEGVSIPGLQVDIPELQVDEVLFQYEHDNQMPSKDLSQEESQRNLEFSAVDDEDVSDESDSVFETEGSHSDIASLSCTSRRKERFDFQSSADESSSEYNLFSKRSSLDSPSGRKLSRLLRSRDNNGDNSNDSSLQSTLKSSGTLSMQSTDCNADVEDRPKQKWTAETDDLYEMTLYVQGQSSSQASDISQILLLDNSIREDKSVIHSLWKDALPQLADLDFYVRESIEQHLDEGFMETTSFLKYDEILHKIKGNEQDVPVNEDFQKLSGEIHKDYQENSEFSSEALTSHLCSCNSSRNKTNELYLHVDGPSPGK